MTLSEEVLDQQLSKFQKKLNAMAQHHTQALAMICAERYRQDVGPAREQVPWHQRLKDFIQRNQRHVVFTSPVDALPDEDPVIVIDGSYTVVSSGSQPGNGSQRQENEQ